LPILIGTDVLSRGIDVVGIDLVVNYDVPPDPEDYIHRIGRTARAERTGTAITFVNSRDSRRFLAIERLMERKVEEAPLPEGIEAAAQVPDHHERRRGNQPNKKRHGGKPKHHQAPKATHPEGGGTTVAATDEKPDSQKKKKKRPFKRRNKGPKPDAPQHVDTPSSEAS